MCTVATMPENTVFCDSIYRIKHAGITALQENVWPGRDLASQLHKVLKYRAQEPVHMRASLPIRPPTKVVWVVRRELLRNFRTAGKTFGLNRAERKKSRKSNPELENLYQLAKDKLFLECFLRFSVRMGGSTPKGNSFKTPAAGNWGRQSDFNRAGSNVVKFR